MNAAISPLLEAKNLRCSRGGRVLFGGLSFILPVGGILQIIGANGSGKTSLINILCGLLSSDGGSLFWRQKNTRRYVEEYRNDIAYVGHKDGIKSELTPLENLQCAAAMCDDVAISPQQALEQWGAPIAAVPCRTLSAGQRRRVALSRLWLSNARLWLLDEPLTALDADGQQQLSDMAVAHTSNGGGVIMSTHQRPRWPMSPQILELVSP
ncbi:cytochrome c biogenesis heme-transporting ATPase CcmA [Candidatus Persebacteraceae bacterium Df01]|jgi:heme exporter protein A|uniref:Cytochrome c biogenesis heme-transporting ATPase CcmA n=1 Tax=Candidatus Doriopsillibacter californiensis TaxID=2970740 RepID=A0ABT7QL68_9GAMM|nr:cytochrome c biogenesis heme-transporting ATPase CcmA [Candidatus Persebacteraceae bacterium Df01]